MRRRGRARVCLARGGWPALPERARRRGDSSRLCAERPGRTAVHARRVHTGRRDRAVRAATGIPTGPTVRSRRSGSRGTHRSVKCISVSRWRRLVLRAPSGRIRPGTLSRPATLRPLACPCLPVARFSRAMTSRRRLSSSSTGRSPSAGGPTNQPSAASLSCQGLEGFVAWSVWSETCTAGLRARASPRARRRGPGRGPGGPHPPGA